MKKGGVIAIAVAAVAVVCGAYFLVNRNASKEKTEETELTEVQKLITKDLDTDYPMTPREVVKFYNRILTAYYDTEFEEGELEVLTGQALLLFDDELAANNPPEQYLSDVEADIEEYHSSNKRISSTGVCDSDEVKYLEDGGDSIAYVTASYFIKEGTDYSRTYEMYVLRRDEEGHWKILVYYQIENESTEEQ